MQYNGWHRINKRHPNNTHSESQPKTSGCNTSGISIFKRVWSGVALVPISIAKQVQGDIEFQAAPDIEFQAAPMKCIFESTHQVLFVIVHN